MTRDDKIAEAKAAAIKAASMAYTYKNMTKGECLEVALDSFAKAITAPASPPQVSEAMVEAVKPIKRWLAHLSAIGSRRLEDNERPEINGAPKMGELRKLVAEIERLDRLPAPPAGGQT